MLVLGFFCLLTVGLVTVWHQVDTLRVGYDVSRLRRRVEDLHRDCDRLTVSVTSLESPPVIEDLACRYRLALVRPSRDAATSGMQARAAISEGRNQGVPSRQPAVSGAGDWEAHRRVAGPGSGRYPTAGRMVGWVNEGGLTGRP